MTEIIKTYLVRYSDSSGMPCGNNEAPIVFLYQLKGGTWATWNGRGSIKPLDEVTALTLLEQSTL